MNTVNTKILILLSLTISLILCNTGFADYLNHSVKIEKIKMELVDSTCYSVKSVNMNGDYSKVYTTNLEGMNVYEFDRVRKIVTRKLDFVHTPGRGYNYQKRTWLNSYQEKPVESFITHNGRYLWVSLHNAGGVAIWDLTGAETYVNGKPFKEGYLYDRSAAVPANKIDSKTGFFKKRYRSLLIKTGTTPKVIAATADGRYLFVANWHSNSISILSISSPNPVDWVKIKEIKTCPIPRGMVTSSDSKYLYVAQMGSNYISAINLDNLKNKQQIHVGVNPRHIVMRDGYIYSSLALSSKLVKVNLTSQKVVKSVDTKLSPRTIALSRDGKIIFVTCYTGNYIQAFSTEDLSLLGSWKCPGAPVAIGLHQEGDIIEAWVGNEKGSTLKVFTFRFSRSLNGIS